MNSSLKTISGVEWDCRKDTGKIVHGNRALCSLVPEKLGFLAPGLEAHLGTLSYKYDSCCAW